MISKEFCAGQIPDVDECHKRMIVAVGVHAGMTYEQMLSNSDTLEYCGVIIAEHHRAHHLEPFVSWLRDNDRHAKKCKADLDVFKEMSDEEKATRFLSAGKHRGLTFREVVQDHPDYCRIVIQRFDSSPLSTDMRYFVEYLKSVDLPEQPVDPNAADRGACLVDYGRIHRGKTYQQVKETDTRYCQWVISQDNPGSMKRFADFLIASGVTLDEPAVEVHTANT
jgi:hypothetical protein